MRVLSIALAACLMAAASAHAQTAPAPIIPGQPAPGQNTAPDKPMTGTPSASADDAGTGNRAVKNPAGRTIPAPAAGANSFTEGQARSRIENRGYTHVSGLVKGEDGVWRGRATGKDGASVEVALDYKGDLTAK